MGQPLYLVNPVYTIVKGDTLSKLAKTWNTTVELIVSTNKLSTTALQIGQKLMIPHEPVTTVTPPTMFADAIFPMLEGTYSPYPDSYGDARTFNPNGTAVRKHEGIDIFAKTGTPLFSPVDGKVVSKGWLTLGGYRISMQANEQKTAFYFAHLSAYAPGIEIGSTVRKGQLIGYVGDTGYGPEGTTGKFLPHLHFGMYDTSTSSWVAQNPFLYLKWWESR
jgi:hypothetical protein